MQQQQQFKQDWEHRERHEKFFVDEFPDNFCTLINFEISVVKNLKIKIDNFLSFFWNFRSSRESKKNSTTELDSWDSQIHSTELTHTHTHTWHKKSYWPDLGMNFFCSLFFVIFLLFLLLVLHLLSCCCERFFCDCMENMGERVRGLKEALCKVREREIHLRMLVMLSETRGSDESWINLSMQ